MTPDELADVFDATFLPPDRSDTREPCAECGRLCSPVRPGQPTSCVPCSVVPLGETWPGLAHRVSHHLTRNQWAKLDTVADIPAVPYRQWRKRYFGG